MLRRKLEETRFPVRASDELGFSLVEIVVAVLVLSVTTLAFLNLFDAGLLNVFSSGHRNDAMEFAFEIMERLYARTSPHTGEYSLNTKDDIRAYLVDPLHEGFYVDGGHEPNPDHPFSFYLVDTEDEPKVFAVEGTESYEADGVTVTIAVFYLDSRTVSLTSFVRRE